MSGDLKQTTKKIRRGSRGKHQFVTLCRREQEMILDSITDDTDDTDATQDNVLMELGAQLASKLKVSMNFNQKLECSRPNWVATYETLEQITSNSSEYETDVAQQANKAPPHASMLWVSPSCRSAASNTMNDSTTQDENESTGDKKKVNKGWTSVMTSLPKIDVLNTCRSMNKNVTVCGKNAMNVSDKAQNVPLNSKSKSKVKMKLDKMTVANRLYSSQIQGKHSVTDKVGVACKLLSFCSY